LHKIKIKDVTSTTERAFMISTPLTFIGRKGWSDNGREFLTGQYWFPMAELEHYVLIKQISSSQGN
jgi:hypothetical protein